jgi:uncharacterized RDD family membrane protein YckC
MAQVGAPISWEPPPEVAQGPAPGIRFAPHLPRLVAYVIDTFVLVLIAIAWALVIGLVAPILDRAPLIVLFVLVMIVVLLGLFLWYFVRSWMQGGQTLGMRPFNLYVVRDVDGGPITRRQAWLRVFGLFVIDGAVLYLGFLWVFIDHRRRAWHDIMAGTVVIQK